MKKILRTSISDSDVANSRLFFHLMAIESINDRRAEFRSVGGTTVWLLEENDVY